MIMTALAAARRVFAALERRINRLGARASSSVAEPRDRGVDPGLTAPRGGAPP